MFCLVIFAGAEIYTGNTRKTKVLNSNSVLEPIGTPRDDHCIDSNSILEVCAISKRELLTLKIY